MNQTQEYISRIRALFNSYSGDIDDAKAIELIEEFVLSEPSRACRTHDENHQLIRRIFLSLRTEMDILQPFVDDPEVTEIMVNGRDDIFIEKHGKIYKAGIAFESVEDLEELIRRIAARVHREINEKNPVVDARLLDGSRVNAVFRGVAINGPILTIRKFPRRALTMEDLVKNGTLPADAARLLESLVRARYNCFISGGTSSGKTTLLNVLSQSIPSGERVVVIEDSAELMIDQIKNIVRLECRNANTQGRGAIDMAKLVRNSLRMRPDRIIVGEVRGEEVLDMIQAMNTGHDGSMSTGHANSVEGMLKRLEAMFLQAVEIPVQAIRSQIAEGIDIMIHLGKTQGGSRRLLEIAELYSSVDGSIGINRLYHWKEGLTANPLVRGEKLDEYENRL